MLKRKRVLAAKIETTVGTPIALSGSDGTFNVYDTEMLPTRDFIERRGQGAFSRIVGSIGPASGTVTFKHDLTPGSGGLPAWASIFLPACGMVASSSVFSPKTEAPGANVKTLTIGLYADGIYKQLHGAVGNVVFRFPSGRPVVAEFTFTGVWSDPTDVAMITPTYPTLPPLRFVNSGLVLGAWNPKVAELTFDLGNSIVVREDSTTDSGYHSAIITDRLVTGTMNPESVLAATKNYYAEWRTLVEQEIETALTNGDGLGITFNAPKAQIRNVQEGDRGEMQIDTIDFQCNRSASAGDDEFTIAFDTSPTP